MARTYAMTGIGVGGRPLVAVTGDPGARKLAYESWGYEPVTLATAAHEVKLGAEVWTIHAAIQGGTMRPGDAVAIAAGVLKGERLALIERCLRRAVPA